MTDITELTQEAARESGSILIIVAARMARREFFTPLHALCEAGKRVVSTRALHDAVERAEERMVSQVPKIVDGHDRLTKKLKEAESRNAELVEALEKTQKRIASQREYYEGVIADGGKRIAELEESHAQVIQSRDHYKRMTEEGLKQLAEARTVNLPEPEQWDITQVLLCKKKVVAAIRAAGIKVEAE